MRRHFGVAVASVGIVVAAISSFALTSRRAEGVRPRRLTVAVTTADVEAIVKAVGGDDVDTFSLFRGCILRRDLQVEEGAVDRMAKADAIVWTGFFNESSAIHASVEGLPAVRRAALGRPLWIDVSPGAARVNVPTSSCEGYVELQFMHGDPFFWLNPRNGSVIARNAAEGLSLLRPERAATFVAREKTFSATLAADIGRWQRELAQLSGLRVFSAQCGWQNLSQLGGPRFITCRKPPGELDPPATLAAQVQAQSVDIVIVDPNTPLAYAEAFRHTTTARVITVPSSIADLPGATSYGDLFDNFIRQLRSAASPR